ncbi:MAG: hypothetical protein OWQ54_03370 [Sulfolobaceae archaeon]|nr:hypothetical protein [Sulfolobaceae archaeon]
MNAFGRIKRGGIHDKTVFLEVLLAIKSGICENITIISNDEDLVEIRNSLINNLKDFIESSSSSDHKNYAIELRNLISSNIKVIKLKEILSKLTSFTYK